MSTFDPFASLCNKEANSQCQLHDSPETFEVLQRSHNLNTSICCYHTNMQLDNNRR